MSRKRVHRRPEQVRKKSRENIKNVFNVNGFCNIIKKSFESKEIFEMKDIFESGDALLY